MTFILHLSLSIILLASTPIVYDEKGANNSVSTKATPIYISEWENSTSWISEQMASNKHYFLKRPISQLTNDVLDKGVVLVYSKGYHLTESSFVEKPIQIPFYFFASDDNLSSACQWSISKTPGEIELSLSIPETADPAFQQKKNKIQFRYILLDESFLKKHKLTKSALMNMNYLHVIKLINAIP